MKVHNLTYSVSMVCNGNGTFLFAFTTDNNKDLCSVNKYLKIFHLLKILKINMFNMDTTRVAQFG